MGFFDRMADRMTASAAKSSARALENEFISLLPGYVGLIEIRIDAVRTEQPDLPMDSLVGQAVTQSRYIARRRFASRRPPVDLVSLEVGAVLHLSNDDERIAPAYVRWDVGQILADPASKPRLINSRLAAGASLDPWLAMKGAWYLHKRAFTMPMMSRFAEVLAAPVVMEIMDQLGAEHGVEGITVSRLVDTHPEFRVVTMPYDADAQTAAWMTAAGVE